MLNNHLNEQSKITCYQLAYTSKETLTLKLPRSCMEGLTINVLTALSLRAVFAGYYVVYCKYSEFFKPFSLSEICSPFKIRTERAI